MSGPRLGSTIVTGPRCSGIPCPGEKMATTLLVPGIGLASSMAMLPNSLPK